MNTRSFLIALAAVAILLVVPTYAEAPRAVPVKVSLDETARFLAGLPPLGESQLHELAGERTWKRHADILNGAFAKFEESRLGKVRTWSATHIPDAASAKGTMFYMFSGPDFLFADAIYPGATTYVFCGMEPVGLVPDLTKLRRRRISRELGALRSSLDAILSFSFFITKKMKTELRNHELSGALPIISIFLARAGKTITGVDYVGIDAEGTLHPIDAPKRGGSITAPGVKISFCGSPFEASRTLYYFSTDISDDRFDRTGFRKFCQGLAPGNSLVKSASYLMHNSYFSKVRGFLLENSHTLVQDPSGIPVTYIKAEQWEVRPFGRYPGPIKLFKSRAQPHLFELYRTGDPVPLDFGIGYRHRKGESSLVVAQRWPEVRIDEAPKAVPVTDGMPPSIAVPVVNPAPGPPSIAVPVASPAPVLKAIPLHRAVPVAKADLEPEAEVEPEPVTQ